MNDHDDNAPVPWMQQLLDNPFLLLFLGVFVPMLEETSFPARFLGAVVLLHVWWALSLAIGLGVLYRRRTGGIASSVIGLYILVALVLAVVRSS